MIWYSAVGLALLSLLAGCGAPPGSETQPILRITFLTRDGCVGSPIVRERLEAALAALGAPAAVAETDVADLDASDPLTGFGTPTILVDGFDLFGATAPAPAPPT